MATKKDPPKTHLEGRHAGNGQFRSVEWAREHKNIGVVERVPNPGFGLNDDDDKNGKKK